MIRSVDEGELWMSFTSTSARLSSLSPTIVSYPSGEAAKTLESRAVIPRDLDRLEEGAHKNLMKFKKTKLQSLSTTP